MENSRIFVRGLPPNISQEDFKNHFSKPAPVTDAKCMPHRRIGYVGYKTHKDALKAVKYFNKSYIRMSRIGVELARPAQEDGAQSAQTNANAIPIDLSAVEKRKRHATEDSISNPKLQEFLQVMQAPSKSKTWANEDLAKADMKEKSALEEVPISAEALQDKEYYERVPKKRKRSPEAAPKSESRSKPEEVSVVVFRIDEATETKVDDMQPAGEEPKPAILDVTAASDADWLRSRTSRLLGLVNDDEFEVPENAKEIGTDRIEEATDQDKPDDTRMVSSASQTDNAELQQKAEVERSLGEAESQPVDTARLFVRNLSYETSESDLRSHFIRCGNINEVHVPVDSRSGTGKGFAYIQYENPESAQRALAELDRNPFQGRLLHILPASAKKEHVLDEYAISQLPIKKQRQIRRKLEASSSTFKWNSMYMNADAIISSISSKLGVSKSEILDPTSSDAAVIQAHAETNIIQETKAYFAANGVNLEAFKKHEFSETAILVKNFPYGTTPEELQKALEAFGTVTRLLMPPSGTIAIVSFEQATQARSAFGALSYRKFKDSVLFLEKAPKYIFDASNASAGQDTVKRTAASKPSTVDLLDTTAGEEGSGTSTLFVRNLNFTTSSEKLGQLFQPLDGFMSARVKTKTDPKKPGQILSMGFGFLEYRTKQQAQAAMIAMNGYKLDGHDLLIKQSHKSLDAAEERRKEDRAKKIAGRRTKIIIKNLPFEASKKDIQALFGSYGKLRSVRVPRKFDSSTRGFAFANFATAREAENAMDALRDTHLLGRRLVLDFAAEEAIDPEEEIQKMQQKVEKQTSKVALQKLTSVGRKKFNIGEVGDDED